MGRRGPIRIAVVGCGWAGLRHAEAYDRCDAEIAWAVDRDLSRATVLARGRPDVQVASDFRDALADAAVDAVDVCLPHDLHAPVCIEAADAGKHILCEKPIAPTLADADRMIEAADRSGVLLMVAENVRFDPLYRTVGEFLKDGVIGAPALLHMTREANLGRSFSEERPWFLDARAAGGGVMMSGGIHDFETMRMLIGEIASVSALRAPRRLAEMDGDDTSVAMVRFQNGAVGLLVESFATKRVETLDGEVQTLRIDGELGVISVDDGRTIRLDSEREDLRLHGSLARREVRVPVADTFFLEIEHFLDAVRTGQEPLTSGCAQRRPLEIVLAAYQSMAQGGQPLAIL